MRGRELIAAALLIPAACDTDEPAPQTEQRELQAEPAAAAGQPEADVVTQIEQRHDELMAEVAEIKHEIGARVDEGGEAMQDVVASLDEKCKRAEYELAALEAAGAELAASARERVAVALDELEVAVSEARERLVGA